MVIYWKKKIVPLAVKKCRSLYRTIGTAPTLRSVFYALLAYIPNTQYSYKQLSRVLVDARLDGKLPWYLLGDGSSRESSGSDYGWNSTADFMDRIKEDLENSEDRFKLPTWQNQEYYVEVWTEKGGAIYNAVRKWLKGLNVTVGFTQGYSSWSFLKERVEHIKLEKRDRKPVILLLYDFDPSGQDIPRFLKKSVGELGLNSKFVTVGITKEQIEKYKLPHRPQDKKEIEKLRSDPRFQKWSYGLYRVELDSLLGRHPKEFKKIVVDRVNEYFDKEIYEKVQSKEKKLRKQVRERIKELTKGLEKR